MQKVSPKWARGGLVLVCERCFKERIPEEDPKAAERIGDFHLRDWLKERLKQEGHWGAIRAVSTSCLDVCARERVTVCVDPRDGEPSVIVLAPIAEREELYKMIVKMLGEREIKA
jgi:predicted metal-binding protein